jgi:hypothetical protein
MMERGDIYGKVHGVVMKREHRSVTIYSHKLGIVATRLGPIACKGEKRLTRINTDHVRCVSGQELAVTPVTTPNVQRYPR